MKRPLPPEALLLDRIDSPIGTILLVHDEAGAVRALDFADYEARLQRLLQRHWGQDGIDFTLRPGLAPVPIRTALAAYFSGSLSALDEMAVTTGGTPFQRQVWAGLRRIPAGMTLSYGGLAERLGRPSAMRAVGLANGANPVAIIVPCHRVIGADASLTGYGGGLPRKKWLLQHEGAAFKDSETGRRAA
jgi:methylated-DNA-[protein]-cysteine S-methyltransferase